MRPTKEDEDTKEGGRTNRMMSLLRERTSAAATGVLRRTIQSSYNDCNDCNPVPGGSLAGLTKSANRMAEPLAPVFSVQPGPTTTGTVPSGACLTLKTWEGEGTECNLRFMHGIHNAAVDPMFLLG